MALDPVASAGLLQLAMKDPEKFGEVMARSGKPPPEKGQERLPGMGEAMEPKPVQTQSIPAQPQVTAPEQLTPAQRITGAEQDIAGRVDQLPGPLETQASPGGTMQQALGQLMNKGLVAGPQPGTVETAMPAVGPADRAAPADLGSLLDPAPASAPAEVRQLPGSTTEAVKGERVDTGTNSGLGALAKALSGVKAPEQAAQPRLAAPNIDIPSVQTPSAPSAPSGSAPAAASAPAANVPAAPRGGGSPQQLQLLMNLLLGGKGSLPGRR